MPDQPPPDQSQVPSLLDMAQGSPPPGGWAPDWVKQQLPTNLAYWAAHSGAAPTDGGAVDTNAAFSGGAGSLSPWLNPDNWGPPPQPQSLSGGGSGSGWFPEFNNLASDPNEKFWSMKDYASQLPGGPGAAAAMDESPNTRNWRLLGGAAPGSSTTPGGLPVEAGNFMYLGHPISQNKLFYDLHRPIDTQEGAGVPGGSIHYYPGFGTQGTAWSTAGQVGYPGQLDPFATSWGAGGP